MIRDISRQISDGIEKFNFLGVNVGIVDERGEIAAMYNGIPENDVGIRTDVLNNVKKYIGIEMLIRSMAPKVVIADEIGNKEDVEAIKYAMCSGVKGIFTTHGNSFENLKENPIFNEMFELKLFQRIIFLDFREKGKISQILEF